MKSDLDITVESSTLTNPGSPNKGIMTFYDIKLVASVVSKQESDPFLVVFSRNVVPDRPTDGAVWIVGQDLPQYQSEEGLKKLSFSNGKVVARALTSSIEKHVDGKLVLPFSAKPYKYYQCWVNTCFWIDSTMVCTDKVTMHRIGLGAKPPSFETFQHKA